MATIKISAEGVEEKYAMETAAVTVGRGLESDIRINDIKASRRHFQIRRTPQGYTCLDLSSGNGTFVNGVQITEQKLRSGDRIQVGSTTITFEEGAPKPVTSPGTARMAPGTASATRPAAPRVASPPAPGKPATGKVPAPTTSAVRPSTTKMPAAPAAKPTTVKTTVLRPSTQHLPRVRTTGIRKNTSRANQFATATQRLRAEERKKRVNPVTVIIAGIIVIFLGAVGYIFFGMGEDSQIVDAQFKKICQEANTFETENEYAKAIAKWNEAMNLVAECEKYKGFIIETRLKIKQLEQQQKVIAKVDEEFRDVEAKARDTALPAGKRLQMARELYDRVKNSSSVYWGGQLKKIVDSLQAEVDKAQEDWRSQDPQVVRGKKIDEHKLNDRTGAAQYAAAIRDWKEYIAKQSNNDSRIKAAEDEINRLQGLANEDLDRFQKKARKIAEDVSRKAEAVDLLKQQRPRFENTSIWDKLQKAIEELEK